MWACHYIYDYNKTKLSLPAKDPGTLVLSSQQWPTCLTYSFYLSHFSEFYPKGRLTEQGSIQPEGTVSRRGSLTSCSTQSREYHLPIFSYCTITQSASKYTLYVWFKLSSCCMSYKEITAILNIAGHKECKSSSDYTIYVLSGVSWILFSYDDLGDTRDSGQSDIRDINKFSFKWLRQNKSLICS